MKPLSRIAVGITAGLAAISLAACSSSGSSSKSSSGGSNAAGSSTTAKAASGAPITIGVPESDNGGGFSDYYVGDGLTAWSKDLNQRGGIGGRPVKLVRCNDQGTTAGATQCTRTQVQNSKILLGTGFSPYSSAITGPGFLKAGIPWLSVAGNSAADVDGTGATECLVPAAIASYQALPEYAIKTLGLKKIAQIRLDVPQLDLVNQEIKTSTSAAGGQLVANIAVPLSAADFSAPLQQAISKGAQVLVLAEIVPATIKIIQTAASLGFKGTIAFGSGYYDSSLQKVINGVSSSGIKFLSNTDFPSYKSSTPDVTAYRNAMQKYGFSKDLGNDQAASGWAVGQYLEKAFTEIGPANVNRDSIKTFLTTKTIPSVPLFSGPVGRANGTKVFPGLGYIKTYIQTIDKDGQHIQATPLDLSATTASLTKS